jgi:hypothetical protein
MSVFDPNKDYTNAKDATSLYDTVMEVQRVLQEITSLLQTQDPEDPPQPTKRQQRVPIPETPDDSEPEDSPEESSTIYDNLFD